MGLESGPRTGRTMKRTRYSDEQIIGILAEHEAGAKCADRCRRHGMSEGAFYNWKAKNGGMAVPDAKRLKALEDENARLKKLLAEQVLDGEAGDVNDPVNRLPVFSTFLSCCSWEGGSRNGTYIDSQEKPAA